MLLKIAANISKRVEGGRNIKLKEVGAWELAILKELKFRSFAYEPRFRWFCWNRNGGLAYQAVRINSLR